MSSRTSAPIERRIALCYVRVSSAPSIVKESLQKEKRAARRSKTKPKNKPSSSFIPRQRLVHPSITTLR